MRKGEEEEEDGGGDQVGSWGLVSSVPTRAGREQQGDGQEACSNMPVSRVPDLGRGGMRASHFNYAKESALEEGNLSNTRL